MGPDKNPLRFGIVGLGSIGARHAAYLNATDGARLAAVCDADETKLHKYSCPGFTTHQEMFASNQIDAVLIATPHFGHPQVAIDAFAANLHVLCEKPLAVSIQEARRVIDAHAQSPHLTFGLMFQQRTFAVYRTLRNLITSGQLGNITRITWLMTDWFRTDSYYAAGGWRATWAGEGGGVLLNQCPHNLDLLYWLTGMMPSRITAVANIGKTHDIEVEDEVTAILEYSNGALGQFSTSTGEAPGTDRLEIVGDNGRVVTENGKLQFFRTRQSVKTALRTLPPKTRGVEADEITVPLDTTMPEGHQTITQNFVHAVLNNQPLIAPGVDGDKSLELGNAMLMAGLTRRSVTLPLDVDQFENFLHKLIAGSSWKKSESEACVAA